MTARYPGLTREEPITPDMLAPGLAFLSPASRSYIEVAPNYVTLHIAVWTNRDGVTGRVVIPAGLIPEELRPAFAVRAPMRHGSEWASALWGPAGQLEIEGRDLAAGAWLNGSIQAKRGKS